MIYGRPEEAFRQIWDRSGLEGFQEEMVPGLWLNGWAEVCQVSR